MFEPTTKTTAPANGLPVPDGRTFKSTVLDEVKNKAITAREADGYLTGFRAEADACRMFVHTSITKASLEGGQRLRHATARWHEAKVRWEALQTLVATYGVGNSNVAHTLQALAILVIQAAEYVFMWTVLPMVVGVRQHSLEGVSLAALAVAALLTLEYVFANLGVAKAHRLGLSVPAGSSRGWTTGLAAGGFMLALLLLLGLNLGLINEIAVLREIGISLGLSTDAGLQLDRASMGLAMRIISIAVAVDGGILLVLFEVERQRRTALRALEAARTEVLALGQQAREALAQWRTLRDVEHRADALADNARAMFMAEAELRVQQAIQRSAVAEPKTLQERVARLIGHPIGAM